MPDGDTHDLARFLVAQDAVSGGITAFDKTMREVRAGEKVSHWMWFIYPQLRALGRSSAARCFGITGLAEARAYWIHPILGARPHVAVCTTLASGKREADVIFGDIDALKLRSCLTLFLAVAPEDAGLLSVLHRFYDGAPDRLTTDAFHW
jgi:uncharacterized protein (DUF1810 family)